MLRLTAYVVALQWRLVMNADYFKKYFMCEFTGDERIFTSQERLHDCYKTTEHYSNTYAREEYKILKEWVYIMGYTQEEFTQAKQVVSGWEI